MGLKQSVSYSQNYITRSQTFQVKNCDFKMRMSDNEIEMTVNLCVFTS